MTEISELLDRTARSADVTPSAETVEADVERGRAALASARRRRALRIAGAGVVATCVLAGAVAIGLPDGTEDAGGPSGGPAGVRLVAYTGDQLDGFVVDQAPTGWFLQGSSQYSLTIAPEGDETHPDDYVGKLVVFLLSRSAKQELPAGEPVEVGGRDAVISRDGGGDAATLTYEDPEGHFVQVQAPDVLGWTNDEVAQFAEGVEVTADAKAGVG
jgi:hypothetical protein